MAVPVAAPVTIPVEPTVATELLLLVHVPPDTGKVNVVVELPHITAEAGEITGVNVALIVWFAETLVNVYDVTAPTLLPSTCTSLT